MGTINSDWHLKNPMPKNPTLDQRVSWHLAHAAACSCREMPESVVRELKARGIEPPRTAAPARPPRPSRKRRPAGA